MNLGDSRKILTVKTYSMIFKKILPSMHNSHKIGNPEHAEKINSFGKQRSRSGYVYDDFGYLKLKVEDSASSPEFDLTVKENNFNNWINGTSSPKNLVIINSILEYVIEVCEDKDKLMLLKYETLPILRSGEFHDYAEHMIDSAIETWIRKIEADDSEALFKAVKEIMYLLKNKAKFTPYLLKENEGDKKETSVEEVKTEGKRILNVKYIIAALLILIIGPLFIYVFNNIHLSKSVADQTKTPVAYIPDESIAASGGNNVSESNIVLQQSTISVKKLSAPRIITPSRGSLLPISDIKVQWETVSSADDYRLVVTEINTPKEMTIINQEIKDSSIVLDKTLFIPGRNYRIYVNSIHGALESLPEHIDFSTQKLSPPKVIEPLNLASISLSDIKVRWTPASFEKDYKLVVTETSGWEKIFTRGNIKDTFFTLDKSLLTPGGTYRIYVHSTYGMGESVPAYIDISIKELAAPKIISPLSGAALPVSDIKVQWEPVDYADGYTVAVVDTNKWEKILEKAEIEDTFISLDKSLFTFGGSYRIYIFSDHGMAESAPNYIDFSIEMLSVPKITNPVNGDLLPLADMKVEWEPVKYADSYTVTVTDTDNWTKVFSKSNIKDAFMTLDKSLFNPGGNYRIYVHSDNGTIESEPGYLDVAIDPK